MNATVYPTDQKHLIATDEAHVVEVREWRGETSGGVAVKMFVVGIAPVDQSDAGVARLEKELPRYFDGEFTITITETK